MAISFPERKRMSVIVKDSAGDIWLYCKGADSVIFPLTTSGQIDKAVQSVSDFSKVCHIIFLALWILHKNNNKVPSASFSKIRASSPIFFVFFFLERIKDSRDGLQKNDWNGI